MKTTTAVVVVHPSDADMPIRIFGDYTIEYSDQVEPGTSLLLTESDIQDGIDYVLTML